MARAARYAFAGLSAANVSLRWRSLGQWRRGFRAWVVNAEKGELKSREAGQIYKDFETTLLQGHTRPQKATKGQKRHECGGIFATPEA